MYTVWVFAFDVFLQRVPTFHNVYSSTPCGTWLESMIILWRSRGSIPVKICFWIQVEALLRWLTSSLLDNSDNPDKSDKFETVDETSSFSSAVSNLQGKQQLFLILHKLNFCNAIWLFIYKTYKHPVSSLVESVRVGVFDEFVFSIELDRDFKPSLISTKPLSALTTSAKN